MQNCVLSTNLALNNILDFNFRTVKFMVIKLLVVERFVCSILLHVRYHKIAEHVSFYTIVATYQFREKHDLIT